MRDGLGQIVKVVGGNAKPIQLGFEELPMQVYVGMNPGFVGDAEQVCVIVAEHDMNVMREAIRQFINDKRRAQIAAARPWRHNRERCASAIASFQTLS